MPPEEQTRLPLQIGTSSLWSAARAAASLVSGPALVVVAVAAFFDDRVSFAIGAGLVVAGVLLFLFGVTHVQQAVRSRASDVVLRRDGVRIEGGRFHGLTLAWSEIDRTACELAETKERRLTALTIAANAGMVVAAIVTESLPDDIFSGEIEILRLRLARRNGPPLVVAEAERPIEKDSLRALHESIRADHWYTTEAPAPQPAPPSVVACTACGAAAVPEDAATVACAYCGATVAIPETVRAGVRDGRAIGRSRRRSEHLVSRLVRQPGAARVGLELTFAWTLMMLAWPVAIALTLGTADPEMLVGLGVRGALPPVLFALSTILGLFCVARARLSDRFALRLLTLEFGARRPAAPGAPFTCRRCGAPLGPARDAIVASCVYCGTENVLGVDLGHRASSEAQQSGTLAEALQQRGRERRLWRRLAVAALVVLAADACFLARGPVRRWIRGAHPRTAAVGHLPD